MATQGRSSEASDVEPRLLPLALLCGGRGGAPCHLLGWLALSLASHTTVPDLHRRVASRQRSALTLTSLRCPRVSLFAPLSYGTPCPRPRRNRFAHGAPRAPRPFAIAPPPPPPPLSVRTTIWPGLLPGSPRHVSRFPLRLPACCQTKTRAQSAVAQGEGPPMLQRLNDNGHHACCASETRHLVPSPCLPC